MKYAFKKVFLNQLFEYVAIGLVLLFFVPIDRKVGAAIGFLVASLIFGPAISKLRVQNDSEKSVSSLTYFAVLFVLALTITIWWVWIQKSQAEQLPWLIAALVSLSVLAVKGNRQVESKTKSAH